MVLVFYLVAIVISAAAVYYLNIKYNPPQPLVHLQYNYTTQTAMGYIVNTLPFPINVSAFYCTAPNGTKMEFENPAENEVPVGANLTVVVQSNYNALLEVPCSNWKVLYMKSTYTTTAIPTSANGLYVNTTGGNAPNINITVVNTSRR